jgi:hypothetical protein
LKGTPDNLASLTFIDCSDGADISKEGLTRLEHLWDVKEKMYKKCSSPKKDLSIS